MPARFRIRTHSGWLPWLVLAALVVVALIVVRTHGRLPGGEAPATRLMLEEKGAAIIRVLEAAGRTSTRPRMGNLRLQYLLEEICRQPDVLYAAMLTGTGMLAEYSDERRAGAAFLSLEDMRLLKAGTTEGSAQLMLDGEAAFAVYRFFTPFQTAGAKHDEGHTLPDAFYGPPGAGWHRHSMGGTPPAPSSPAFPAAPPMAGLAHAIPLHPGTGSLKANATAPIILVGLDPAPLFASMEADTRRTALLSGLVLAWGAAAGLCLFWFLRARGAKLRLQAEVRRREQLTTAGDLAAGVAHELRNPLSSIKGYATYFAGRFAQNSPEREAAEVMVQEVERLNRAISDLVSFARPSDMRPRATDLNTLVEHGLGLIRQDAAGQGVTIVWNPGTLPPLLLDPDRFSQALLNVLLNALEAMPQGGTLTLTSVWGPTGGSLTVADTGVGLGAEAAARVFDPYFTTKSQGTGLGLAIVHKIMEAHNAAVGIRPGDNGGAVVTFSALRRAERAAPREEP